MLAGSSSGLLAQLGERIAAGAAQRAAEAAATAAAAPNRASVPADNEEDDRFMRSGAPIFLSCCPLENRDRREAFKSMCRYLHRFVGLGFSMCSLVLIYNFYATGLPSNYQQWNQGPSDEVLLESFNRSGLRGRGIREYPPLTGNDLACLPFQALRSFFNVHGF